MVVPLRPGRIISPRNHMGLAAVEFQHHGTCPSNLLILHIENMSEQERCFYPTRQMEEFQS